MVIPDFKFTPYERAQIEVLNERAKANGLSVHWFIGQLEALLTQRAVRDQATAIVLAKQDHKP